MEKMLNPYDKECMRMAILKHEETFKQQVYELHRLYQVQKIMMKNMEINRSKQQMLWNSNNIDDNNNVNIGEGFIIREGLSRTKLDLDRRIADGGGGGLIDTEIIDESEIELTLGPSCYGSSRKKDIKKKKTPETPGNSDYGGRSLSSSSTGSSNNGKSRVDLEEQMRQERLLKQQPWALYQVLSLNI